MAIFQHYRGNLDKCQRLDNRWKQSAGVRDASPGSPGLIVPPLPMPPSFSWNFSLGQLPTLTRFADFASPL
jgi:hypothetical protein